MSYIGTEPKDIRSFGRTKFDYTATQGQTAFTGADDDGKVLAFTVGQIEVYVNGILMDDSDFTTTGTGTVTLASAANLNDVINIVSFETNIPDSNYVPASGGTFTGNVTNSGNVTVGGTLGVTGAVTASNGLTVDDDGATPLTVDRATSNGTLVDFQKDGSSVGSIATASELSFNTTTGYASLKVNSEGDGLQYSNVGTRHFGPWLSKDNAVDLGRTNGRFKDLYLGGGAYIGGTSASNKLDDYEEGTWTPSFYSGFSSVSAYTYQVGHYIKIGALVYTDFYLYFTGTGNNNHLSVTGLPFNLSSQHSGLVRGGGISTYNSISSVIQQFYGQGGTNRFNLYYNGNSGPGVSGTQTNKYLIGIFSYKTDA